VQRRVSGTGKICVCRQSIALGRPHAGRVLTVHVSETTIAVELDAGEVRVISRTTTLPVRQIKVDRPYHHKKASPS